MVLNSSTAYHSIHEQSRWLRFLQKIETFCTERPLFRKWYSSMFYKKMTAKEIKAAGIAKGSHILHIGCGPMPFTAAALAHWGAQVTAVEIDPVSASRAQRVIDSLGLTAQITVQTGNGLHADPAIYDGIWISLHVSPKHDIITHMLEKMKPGAALVVRNPRGWLRPFYPRIAVGKDHTSVRQGLGKVSTVIREHQDSRHVSLCSIPAGQSGKIAHAPDHPLLSPLGFRPGKEITITGRCVLGGPIVAYINGRSSAVHRSIAREVLIIPTARQ